MLNTRLHLFIIESSMDLIRLDKYLVLNLKTFSRSHIEQWIQSQKVTVNDKGVKPSYRLRLGDRIEVFAWEPIPTTIKAEPISFAIAYEDEDILIVNKPQGLVVHPAPGHYSGTLVNGLLHHQTTWSGINGVMRPGIVHRIDKDTSGLLVVAKHDDAHRFLADQLKTHQMKRDYLALVHGVISEDKGTIIAPIGRDPDDRQAMDVQAHGKEATTHFTVLQRFTKHTLLACQLETGRTHQIRVHMQYIHHPLESDPVYAKGYVSLHNQGQLLHAHRLTLIHPRTKQELIVEAPLPEYFLRILAQLR